MPTLHIVGWRKGLLKISMTKTLRDRLSIGLKDAKACTDDVLKGKLVSFNIGSSTDAESLKIALEELGAIVEIDHD